MGVTDIVRGADHVTNTATQIQIIEALGGAVPRFAHHSLLTGPEGEALSKRLGSLALRDFRAQGIEPMAVLSLMARLGSSQPVEPCESVDEVVQGFDLGSFGSAPTKFDPADLGPLSARLLARTPLQEVAPLLAEAGVPEALAPEFWQVVRTNVATRAEVADWWRIVSGGAAAEVADEDREFVETALGLLGDPPYGPETWSDWTARVKEATGRKGRSLFMPLRHAVTGRTSGPEMADLMPLLQARPHL